MYINKQNGASSNKLPAGLSRSATLGLQRNDSRKSVSTVATLAQNSEELTAVEMKNLRRFYNVFDSSGTGTVGVSELYNVLRALGVGISRNQADQLIQDLDIDGDGTLKFEELVQLLLRNRQLLAGQRIPDLPDLLKIVLSTLKFRTDIPWRWIWESMVLFMCLYYATCLPIFAMYKTDTFSTAFLDLCGTIIFTLDMILWFRTPYLDATGKLITSPPAIRSHYLRSWFVVDLLTCLPWQIYRWFFPDGEAYLSWLPFINMIKLIRVNRLYDTSNIDYCVNTTYVQFVYFFVPIIRLGFWSMVTIHWITLACVALGIGQDSEKDLGYLNALYWVLYTITSTGYGDIPVIGVGPKVMACVLFVVNVLVNGVIVAQMATMFQNKSPDEEKRLKMRETLSLLKHFSVSQPLANHILAFQHNTLRNNVGQAYAEVVDLLPPCLESQLSVFMRMSYFKGVELFEHASENARVALSQRLQRQVVEPEEYIIVMGEVGKEMFFLGHGFAEVIARDGNQLAVLKPGSFFGEVALLEEGARRGASVRALTYCDLFVLNKDDFVDVLKRFPDFRRHISMVAALRKAKQQQQAALSPRNKPNNRAIFNLYGRNAVIAIKEDQEEEEDVATSESTINADTESLLDKTSSRILKNVPPINTKSISTDGTYPPTPAGGETAGGLQSDMAQLKEDLKFIKHTLQMSSSSPSLLHERQHTASSINSSRHSDAGGGNPGGPMMSRPRNRSQLKRAPYYVGEDKSLENLNLDNEGGDGDGAEIDDPLQVLEARFNSRLARVEDLLKMLLERQNSAPIVNAQNSEVTILQPSNDSIVRTLRPSRLPVPSGNPYFSVR